MRGRPKEIIIEPKPSKYSRVFECDECIETWKYDTNKFSKGPIEVSITYKGGLDKTKNWSKLAKEAKEERRTSRQMKKINAKKQENKSKNKRK